jgi:hypothetical protein
VSIHPGQTSYEQRLRASNDRRSGPHNYDGRTRLSARAIPSATSCHAEPTVAGLWHAAHGPTAWLGFACDRDADKLIAPRPLLPRDRDVLERRRDKRCTQSAGHRWAGEQEGPLARGSRRREARRAGDGVGEQHGS